MPQHWVNVFIGLILIVAVLGDIWLRQEGLLARPGPAAAPAQGEARHERRRPLVEMRGISKTFGAVRALADVDLRLYPGEILGLVGDNSAGKSTLMKILTGAYQRDDGEVLVDGRADAFQEPAREPRGRGIEMIYQDFALCGNMDVAAEHLPRPLADARACSSTASGWRRRPGAVLQRLKVDVNSGPPAGREPVRRPAAIGRHRPRHQLRTRRS